MGNLFGKTSSHSPPHTHQVRESNIPTSVPRNNTTSDRSSYARTSLQKDNRARRDLEAELLVALLQRSRSQFSSTSRRPQPTSSPKTQTSSSSKVPQSCSVSSSSTPAKPAKSAPLFKSPESLIDSPSPSQSDSSSEKQPRILKPALTKVAHQQGKTNYLLAENDSLPLYLIPDDVKDLIKKDIVPDVLMKPLSPSTYKDFFAALLYAEDYYYEVC